MQSYYVEGKRLIVEQIEKYIKINIWMCFI